MVYLGMNVVKGAWDLEAEPGHVPPAPAVLGVHSILLRPTCGSSEHQPKPCGLFVDIGKPIPKSIKKSKGPGVTRSAWKGMSWRVLCAPSQGLGTRLRGAAQGGPAQQRGSREGAPAEPRGSPAHT